jgi:hypothetical protein
MQRITVGQVNSPFSPSPSPCQPITRQSGNHADDLSPYLPLQLRVLTSDGIYTFPPPSSTIEDFQIEGDIYNGGPKAELRVLNETFWVRLVLLGDLGFSEGYMAGDVECDDLAALFRVSVDCYEVEMLPQRVDSGNHSYRQFSGSLHEALDLRRLVHDATALAWRPFAEHDLAIEWIDESSPKQLN